MEVKIEQLLEICDDNEIRTKFIHWDNILKEIQLSEEFIEKYYTYLVANSTYNLYGTQNLSIEFLDKYYTLVNWDALSMNPYLNEEMMKKFADKLNWEFVLTKQKLSEEFLDNFVVNLDLCSLRFYDKIKREWSLICYHQNLSEEFIRKHYKDIDWVAISVSQNLSKEFMIEFGNKLSCNDLIIHQKNIDEDVIKIIGKNFDIKNNSDVNMMESFIKIYHSIPNLHELLVNIKNNGRK